ncbi:MULTISPECIES: hypothetical protein [Mesorhizobium]|uniref:hypothetical protein n=1 Tax=Mesorhizobium TaxID=68287 RepID=UPI0010BFCBAD|nr:MULTISPECIES: hypothetical protein [Mesorhizobium]
MRTEITELEGQNDDLTRFVTMFQANELSRATLNLTLAALSADMRLRYVGDQLYRSQSASMGSLRRAAAILHPSRWNDTMKPYEDAVHAGYDTPEAVSKLQDFENDLVAEALSRVTNNQARINALSALNDHYERWRSFLKETFLYMAVALSIFLFFFELRKKDA